MSPITGELVPTGEMAEHMRISLIDPKYREQKEAMMAKIRDTTKGGWPVALPLHAGWARPGLHATQAVLPVQRREGASGLAVPLPARDTGKNAARPACASQPPASCLPVLASGGVCSLLNP